MKLASFFRHIATAALLGGCSVRGIKGDGNITMEVRQISEVTSLDVSGAYEVQWRSGPPSLTITTDQNLLSHVRTEVSGNTLKIRSDDGLAPTKGIKIAFTSSGLSHLDLTGAVIVTAQKVSSGAFSIAAAGASTINMDGSVTEFTVNLTGASRLNAPSLNTKSADVTLVGASSADIAVEEALKATVTGAGSLTYSGQPKSIEKQVTGAGSIRHR